MMYAALMDVISELRNISPPPLYRRCLAKLLWDDVITFIKIEPADMVGPLTARCKEESKRNARIKIL